MEFLLEGPSLVLLWTFVGMIVLWACVPPVGHLLGLHRYRCEEDSGPLPAGTKHPYYADFEGQLLALGFKLVGGCRQTAWFFLMHWEKTFRSLVFRSRERRCFARIYWLNDFDLPRVEFSTVFADGLYVETSNALEELRIQEKDHIRTGYCTRDLGSLLARHEEEITKVRGDAQPMSAATLGPLHAAITRISLWALRRYRGLAVAMLLLPLFFLGVGVCTATLVFDPSPAQLPVGLLMGAVTWLLTRLSIDRAIGAEREQELAQGQPAAASETEGD
jgi:hypothetical protein